MYSHIRFWVLTSFGLIVVPIAVATVSGDVHPASLVAAAATDQAIQIAAAPAPVVSSTAAVSSTPVGATPSTDLAAAVRAARQDFHPLTDADLAQARSDLQAAVDRLDKRLQEAGEGGTEWRTWLKLDRLKTLAAGTGPVDLAELQEIHKRYINGDYGLNLVWFADVRAALGSYVLIARSMQRQQDLKKDYLATLDLLEHHAQQLASKPKPDNVFTVNAALQWLQTYHQAPNLVQEFRRHYGRPNVLVDVSANLVDAAVGGSVDETAPVTDCILGTSIQATAHTYGLVSARLAPDPDRAIIDTYFSGAVDTSAVGYNGPAIICTVGHTCLSAVKRLWSVGEDFYSLPAASDAVTSTTITGVGSQNGRPIVERIASRRAEQQKPEAEVVASCHTRERLNERMDRQGTETLARVNQRYDEKFRQPLIERAVFPGIHYATDPDFLRITAVEAVAHQIAATTVEPPALTDVDLGMRIHETMVNNFCEVVFGNTVLHEQELRDTMKSLFNTVPEEIKGEDAKSPWTIQFPDNRPIILSVGKDEFSILLRSVRVIRADEEQADRTDIRLRDISARYKIETSGNKPKIVRQGEVEVTPPMVNGHRPPTPPRDIFKNAQLAKRFARVFKAELETDFTPTENMAKVGKMIMTRASSQNGWLSFGWRRQPLAEKVKPITRLANQ